MYRFCRRETEGAGPHTIRIEDTGAFFRRTRNNVPFDGIEFEIQGPAGSEIAIRSIRVSAKVRQGGFRKEFVLPAGRIWRAVGNVNRKTLLSANGREVPSSSPLTSRPDLHYLYGQQYQEVDLAPYLKPGPNLIAAYSASQTDGNALLKCRVVMESGEIVDVHTDRSWLYVPERVSGWDQPGFRGETQAIEKEMPFSASYLPAGLTAIRYGYRLYMQYAHALPAYDGRVLLASPGDNQLFFQADRPFRMQARCPAGLAARKPSLEWLLCRYRRDEPLEQVLAGTASQSGREGKDLVFELADGERRIPPGVYVVKTLLRAADGTVLEDRIPEPVIVTGRIPMEQTQGRSFDEGLDLEPEAVLDFTRPDDPAFPWMETDGKQVCAEPLIVTRNGLTYRETRPAASDYSSQVLITYNYAFSHPGDFYLMRLEYPDDRPRFFGVGLCSEHDGQGDHSKAGPSVWTGIGSHLNTGRMQELVWLFRPDPGCTSINLINMLPGSAAAASKLRILRVRGTLPELKTGGSGRHFGILTESARSYSGFGKTFRSSEQPRNAMDSIYTLPGKWEETARTSSPVAVCLASFAEWLDTSNRYAEYLRWSGQNVILLAFFQYDGASPNAEPLSPNGDSRIVPHITDIAARVFRDNGIDFYSSIEYCSDTVLQARYGDRSDLKDSPFLINGDGKEARVWKTGYNFNHPDVRQSVQTVAVEAVEKFRYLPNFRGLNLTTSFSSPMMVPNYVSRDVRGAPADPLLYDYSDWTIRRFETDTGRKVPIPPRPSRPFPTAPPDSHLARMAGRVDRVAGQQHPRFLPGVARDPAEDQTGRGDPHRLSLSRRVLRLRGGKRQAC